MALLDFLRPTQGVREQSVPARDVPLHMQHGLSTGEAAQALKAFPPEQGFTEGQSYANFNRMGSPIGTQGATPSGQNVGQQIMGAPSALNRALTGS